MNTCTISLNDINASEDKHEINISLPECLRYCPPTSAGWGIVRVGLLVPESALLFVSPSGCARHAAIAGIQLGFWDRFFCYRLREPDIVSGEYMDEIPKIAEFVLQRSKMKSLVLCSTCIDDLLGSDYDALALRIEEKTGVPVRICRMDPICMETSYAPPLKVQETIYSFLKPSRKDDGSINIIGSFSQIDKNCELWDVLSMSGDRQIRHIADYNSFENYQSMADSSVNLLIKPGGKLAVQDMEKRLQIPWIAAYHSYGIERIDQMYHNLEYFLRQPLEVDMYREEAFDALESFKSNMDDSVSIAVGSTANAAPFELARTFLENEINVPYIFADAVQSWEKEHVAWLRKHSPSLKIFSSSHPKMADAGDLNLSADFAIGFDAGYYCPDAKILPWGLDKQPFGYQGLVSILGELQAIKNSSQDLKTMLYASGLVI